MEHQQGSADSWPFDAACAAALVERIAHEIDDSSNERRNILLSDFLCAAWPSRPAQDQ